jgi:hypothetical protein
VLIKISNEDLDKLGKGGYTYLTAFEFKYANRVLLSTALPNRPGLVGVLLKKFVVPPTGMILLLIFVA